ncbi:DUF5683 domain-containing protein [Larkinella bovis]|uniref:DUF5683 domain-containing protein n=1 Tax=Larkinella bovis TaxID=683041 RepID=A0ABW0I5B0_9BACT
MKTGDRKGKQMEWQHYVWMGLLMLLGTGAFGQNPAASVRDTLPYATSTRLVADSLGKPVADTVLLTAKQNAKIRKIVPKKATRLSAILPGLGQIHNGHWWKVPIIYAGFGTLIYFSSYYRDQYKMYREYGIKANYSPNQTAEVPGFKEPITVSQLERAARFSARYRDYNYLGMALLWGVNVIEANVTAHLKTFDVSEDLTMQVKPDLLLPATGGLPVPGVRVAFQFK